jgi:ATP-dependent exoDNAse (exonuclease V) beta subunit
VAADVGSGGPSGPPTAPGVELIEVARAPDRPSGPRFGTLVHAVLATVPLDAPSERVREVAVMQGRVLGADDEEVAAAAEVADRVLAHDLLGRARAAAARHACRREAPVMMTDAAGTLIEGVVDLAFEDAGEWTVVDFKTDQELKAAIDLYRRQVGLYAEMVAAATGQPARPVLMRV